MKTSICPPHRVHEVLGVTREELVAASRAFGSAGSPDSTFYVAEVGSRCWEWNDFNPGDAQLAGHPSWNAAVESVIAAATELYRQFYEVEDVDVTRSFEGGSDRVIGFRLSRDDGRYAPDERYGDFGT